VKCRITAAGCRPDGTHGDGWASVDVDFELFRELHELFRYRGDALILATLAARPPLRYTALAKAIIEVTGHRLADGEINRCLPRLEAGALAVAEGPERRKEYRLTSLGREKGATLNLIVDALRRRGAGSSSDEPVRLRGELQTDTSPDGNSSRKPARHGAAAPSPSSDPHWHTAVDDARRRPAPPNTKTKDVIALPQGDKQAIDTSVPHSARQYNYLLGGKDNFAVDREFTDAAEAQLPGLRIAARENRAFLNRAVDFLVTDAGIRQFLDIGTGLPTADNTHEVAQAIAPESRIVYVDNDPLVLVHARALLNSTPQGRTNYLQADLRDPDAILRDPALTGTLDMSKPVAVMLVSVLHFIPGAVTPIVERLLGAVPSGSYLAVTHGTTDFASPQQVTAIQQMQGAGKLNIWPRGRNGIADLLEGLRIVEPGLVPTSEWRPEPGRPLPSRQDVGSWAVIARKP